MSADDQSPTDPDATRLLPRAEAPSGLPGGTRLREFEVERVIGEGGFSIVYAAVDVNLHRRVALKEYMPTSLARRRDDRTVQPRSTRDRETFDLGRRSFINEARLLARFDHPALVKVHQFWEDNGTAYMVMPLYEGHTLKQWLKQRGEPPGEEELTRIIAPLLDALEHLHAENVFHRDIAPDNVLLLDDGSPVLLDFGAARQVLADSNKALTAILKPSYAPIEQYADMAQLRQGPWTDVYALCAVLYFALTGAAPPSAVARSISDKMVPATKAAGGRYSNRFLRGVDAGLAVRPEARPQSIARLRELLLPSAPPTVKRAARNIAPTPSSTRWHGARRWVVLGVGALALAAGGTSWWMFAFPADGERANARSPGGATAPAPAAAESPVPSMPAPTTSVPAAEPAANVEAPRQAAIDRAPTLSTPAGAPPSTPPAAMRGGDGERKAPVAVERGRAAAVHRVEPQAAGPHRESPGRTRCLQILQRMQLGELPSAEEKAYLKKECT